MEIQQEAERLRCAEIRKACDSGAVIVGNSYYDQSNPHWIQQAKLNLTGSIGAYQFGIHQPEPMTRFVTRQQDRNPISEYLYSDHRNMVRDYMKSLDSAKKVAKMQDYSSFGGQKSSLRKKK